MSDSDSSLDSELLAVAGARKKAGKKRKAVSSDEEGGDEELSSEDVSLDDESDWEDAKPARQAVVCSQAGWRCRGSGCAACLFAAEQACATVTPVRKRAEHIPWHAAALSLQQEARQ